MERVRLPRASLTRGRSNGRTRALGARCCGFESRPLDERVVAEWYRVCLGCRRSLVRIQSTRCNVKREVEELGQPRRIRIAERIGSNPIFPTVRSSSPGGVPRPISAAAGFDTQYSVFFARPTAAIHAGFGPPDYGSDLRRKPAVQSLGRRKLSCLASANRTSRRVVAPETAVRIRA